MRRRRFITCIATAPLLATGACRRQRRVTSTRTRGSSDEAVVLDPHQWATLAAVCARILPTDQEPGATEANVVSYIDGQLAHPPVSGFRRMITFGLRQLEFVARRMHRSSFKDLAPDKQDQVLQMIQRSKRIGGRYTGAQLFQILVVLTLEGFFGDPIYGGNRGRVGWKLIGFVPQQPGPREPYRGRALAGA